MSKTKDAHDIIFNSGGANRNNKSQKSNTLVNSLNNSFVLKDGDAKGRFNGSIVRESLNQT